MAWRREKMEENIWKWWDEEPKYEDGIKWTSLRHNGPAFPPPYERLPDKIKFYYDGEIVTLNSEAEEVAGLYAKMLDHELTRDETFCKNFFTDWKDTMSLEVKEVISALDQCDFREMADYYKRKKTNKKVQQKIGYFFLDGHRQRIGYYNIRPPGLFMGRNSPNRGKLKKKIRPEDVTINCSREEIPEPPPGCTWKEVQHNPKAIWLASWKESPPGKLKYMKPHASSKVMGERDWKKYEVARRLKDYRAQIQEQYRKDWDSEDKSLQQRGVVLYLIDKFALRVGKKTKAGMTAHTFGCCSLRVKHVKLHEDHKGETKQVELKFMGKCSVPYQKMVQVEEKVFRNLQMFKKEKGERAKAELFDQVNERLLNMYLNSVMKGLTTKVFRTHIASITMEQELKNLTHPHLKDKVSSFKEANRKVAELCNHQQTLEAAIEASRNELCVSNKKVEQATEGSNTEELKNDVKTKDDELRELDGKSKVKKEVKKHPNLKSSKLYYIDPRIIVAWCLKWGVPVEKIYTKAQRDKFAWAIQMNNANFEF